MPLIPFFNWSSAMVLHRYARQAVLIIFIAVGLTACQPSTTGTPPVVESSPTPIVILDTPAPQPRNLTVCLGAEPNTLYPLGEPNTAALSVLSAIYDGPIDSNSYGYQAVILKKLPDIKDGDAVLAPVDVTKGTLVVDTNGNVVALDKDILVYPSGCTSADCAVKYDGASPLQMDQLTATFTLLPDLTWSDGIDLTAADSIYAFELAHDWSTPGSKFLVDRTQTYEMVDDLSVQWWGIPGYIDPAYSTNFWAPLPKHAWESIGASDLQTAEISTQRPLGWGAYVVDEWVSGDHIRLSKNPAYFRAAQGLPYIDTLTFRFMPDANTAIARLVAGECDLIDPTVRLDGQVGLLIDMQNAKQLKAAFSQTNVMERLEFGIKPAAYDDGYIIGSEEDRPDFLRDTRTRQAIAYCLDRQKVVDDILYGLTSVPDTYIPAEHPLFNENVPSYPFDPERGAQLLDQAGWVDSDNDPATPRLSMNVPGVLLDTPLTLNYWTTSATQRRQAEEILSESLAQCGIGVAVENFDPQDFYAPGPNGLLFGRKFDLAQFAMGTTGFAPPCDWFTTSQIPDATNDWVGTNVSGYSNPEFDAACADASVSLPDTPEYQTAQDRAQYLYSNDLPGVPLYWRLKVGAARPDMCDYSLDPTASSDLWNAESLNYGQECNP
jgi:peptide/nickel transport system substrate-binding protein